MLGTASAANQAPQHGRGDPAADMIVSVAGDRQTLRAVLPTTPIAVHRTEVMRTDSETVGAPVKFGIRLASSEGRRSTAGYLIQKMYAWRGYAASGPKASPNRVTLIASDAQRALATISVGFDSDEGLVVEDLYRDEVGKLREAGARLCEFTKLAVDSAEQSREVLAMMFHVAYMYARRIHRCTDIVIEVNPRHVRFYERMLGFVACGPNRLCPRVGAPAVLMRLDLAHAQEQIARYGGQRALAGSVRALYPLFFSPAEENGIVARLRVIG